jgi:hypothetical protein
MAGRGHKARDEWRLLEGASLDELRTQFPEQWSDVGSRLVDAASTRRAADLTAFVQAAAQRAAPWRARLQNSGVNPDVWRSARPHLVAERMSRLAAREALSAAAAQVSSGAAPGTASDGAPTTLRFGGLSGRLVQQLFFSHGLVRKPVSMGAFRLLWPLVRQKKILMPLVQPKGIYCFYSRALAEALAREIGGRRGLEIAAGDGTLTGFLKVAGADIRATDNHSWTQAISFPEEVERLDARAALDRHQPQAVVCSFPPPGNDFERHVFRTASVERYLVVTTRHRFAAGDWEAYEQQTTFEMTDDRRLARLVLPPEVDPAVLVFRRRSGDSPGEMG